MGQFVVGVPLSGQLSRSTQLSLRMKRFADSGGDVAGSLQLISDVVPDCALHAVTGDSTA
jgi:hypothetical protein